MIRRRESKRSPCKPSESWERPDNPRFERLTPLLAAEQVEVREATALTLGSLELDAQVIRPHLARALRDEKQEVRRATMRAIQRLGPQGTIFVPDIIMLAESKENLRSVERMLRRFERRGPDVRSLPELVKQLDHKQDSVRLLAIKFLALAGPSAKDAIPALERMREDPSAEVRKQAAAACEQIKTNAPAGQPKDRPRKSIERVEHGRGSRWVRSDQLAPILDRAANARSAANSPRRLRRGRL